MDSSSMIRSRAPFSRLEDKLILRYFLDTKDVNYLGGNEVWKRLANHEKYNPTKRPFQSLRERWRKKLRPNLARYKLSRSEMALLTGGCTGRSHLDSKTSDEDSPPPTARSRQTDRTRAGSAGRCRKTLVRQPTEDKSVDKTPARAASPQSDAESPQIEEASFRAEHPTTASKPRRPIFRESTPTLPENTTIRRGAKESPIYHLGPDPNRRLSDTSPSQSPSRVNGHGRDKKNEDAPESGRENELSLRLSSGDEFPPDAPEENVPPAVRRRKPRFPDRCTEGGGSSPVIETASHRRPNAHTDDSSENLEGVMCGALVPTQSEQAVSRRTRLGLKDRAANDAGPLSPLGYITGGSLPKSRGRRAALTRGIKLENTQASEETLALARPDSPSRVSTQDVLRRNVLDTQRESDESFHSAAQSPLRSSSRETVTSGHSTTRKRRNRGAIIGDEGTSKKSRLGPVSINGGELLLPMYLKLKLPESASMRCTAERAFRDLLTSMFEKHVGITWGPHDDCPGMEEFLFLCDKLRARVFAQTERERDTVLIDDHLHDLLSVPFCTRQSTNTNINCHGAHRFLLDSEDWRNLLKKLSKVPKAREIFED